MKKLYIGFLSLLTLVLFSGYVNAITKQDVAVQKVRITNVQGPLVKGEFIGLTDKARKQGLHKIFLEGKVQKLSTSAIGTKTINIKWMRVIDKVTDEKVYLDTPLLSPNLLVAPDIEVDDEVNVKGDINSVVSKQQEIIEKNATRKQEKAAEEDKKKEEKESSNSSGSSFVGNTNSDSSGSSLSEPTKEAFSAEIAGNKKVVVTADGCDIVSSKATMEANQYKRILEDGEEIQSCSPSDVKYALTADYTVCSPHEDLDAKKAYPRYNLGYIKADGGARTVVDGGYCNVDENQSVDIQENECGNEIDHQTGMYYQKTTLTYNMDSRSYVAQACVRKEESAIPMKKDIKTCSDSFEGGFYTPFFNWYIEKDGVYTSLSECLPDVENKVTLQEEVCTGDDMYTYDYDNQRAYLNKTYFYQEDEDSDRIKVKTCVPSETVYTFQTEIDGATCPFVNNDDKKETIQRGYYFFTGFNEQRIDLKDRCVSVYPAIPYTSIGSVWKAAKTEETVIGNTNDMLDLEINRADYTSNGNLEVNFGWDGEPFSPCLPFDYKANGVNSGNSRQLCFNMYNKYSSISTVKFKRYCLAGLKEPYDIPSLNATVDIENSTETPTYSQTYVEACGLSWGSGGKQVKYHCPTNVRYECTQPKCNLTTMEARPKMERGDGSIFIDNSQSYETKYVCGDGSKLEGKEG
tara:strand:- start:2010 stop:4073 length:2064 start_codon:yes stop_codon:yes gene_type:complete